MLQDLTITPTKERFIKKRRNFQEQVKELGKRRFIKAEDIMGKTLPRIEVYEEEVVFVGEGAISIAIKFLTLKEAFLLNI